MPPFPCHGCGAVKDYAVLEVYPYPDDHIVTDVPIQPLFVLEVEPEDPAGLWRQATVCHHCLHRLDPDMWISERMWRGLTPVTPFAHLSQLPHTGG
jgi:hypothetical protein